MLVTNECNALIKTVVIVCQGVGSDNVNVFVHSSDMQTMFSPTPHPVKRPISDKNSGTSNTEHKKQERFDFAMGKTEQEKHGGQHHNINCSVAGTALSIFQYSIVV